MSNYLIGIGGTGQRVTNAFIQACFMNAIWDAHGNPLQTVSVLIIDKDNNSGNASAHKLHQYQQAHSGPMDKGGPMAKTRLADMGIWEPTPSGDPTSLQSLSSKGPDSVRLMSALFNDYERGSLANKPHTQSAFSDGFKGHPNVGAAYQDVAMQDGINNPTSEIGQLIAQIRSELNASQDVRVCIVASLFGGTGASGLPLLVQSLRAVPTEGQRHLLTIGTVMMLPYFTYKLGAGVQDKIGLAYANRQTRAALQYYQDNGYMNAAHKDRAINETYLIGLTDLPEVGDYSEGGGTQRNRPVFVELSAAFAARHFFITPNDAEPRAWVVGCNVDPGPGNITQLGYGALIGNAQESGRLQQTVMRALRYAMYSQLIVYWGLMQWTEHGEAVQFMPDNTAKIWLKRTKFEGYTTNDNKLNAQRQSLILELDSMMEQNQNFLSWLIDIMRHNPPTDAERVVFPGFGTDQLETLEQCVGQLYAAYARDTRITGDQRPIKRRTLIHGTPSSPCADNWTVAFDQFFPGKGAESYSARILRTLNNARGLGALPDVLNLIYEQCD